LILTCECCDHYILFIYIILFTELCLLGMIWYEGLTIVKPPLIRHRPMEGVELSVNNEVRKIIEREAQRTKCIFVKDGTNEH